MSPIGEKKMNSQAFPSGMRFFDIGSMTSIDLRISGRCVCYSRGTPHIPKLCPYLDRHKRLRATHHLTVPH